MSLLHHLLNLKMIKKVFCSFAAALVHNNTFFNIRIFIRDLTQNAVTKELSLVTQCHFHILFVAHYVETDTGFNVLIV